MLRREKHRVVTRSGSRVEDKRWCCNYGPQSSIREREQRRAAVFVALVARAGPARSIRTVPRAVTGNVLLQISAPG